MLRAHVLDCRDLLTAASVPRASKHKPLPGSCFSCSTCEDLLPLRMGLEKLDEEDDLAVSTH